MEHIIIGTAGHIDHGKTALIKALTGHDTDQTKEEKERGISIHLGFTYFDLTKEKKAGIIDVPGHEKFLPNMLAGICGMDLILLVIALDEGIMPQTREHMDIIEQMNIEHGIIVLTKSDKVDAEWADMMQEEIQREIKDTLFSRWKIHRVSTVTTEGVEQLKQTIISMGNEVQRNRSTAGAFRMPIDRIISLKGLGVLVCGTVMEGRVHTGKELMIYPEGQMVRVRNIQTHGADTEETVAGQRTALLLSNIKKECLKRGMTIAEKDSLVAANRLDVKIQMTRNAKRTLKTQSRMHLHIGTNEVLCRVFLYQCKEISGTEEAYAQLLTEKPISVRKGDRFILRFYSPLETIAGGRVIDANAQKKKNTSSVVELLKKRDENKTEELLIEYLQNANIQPMNKSEILQEVKEEDNIVDSILLGLTEEKKCVEWKGKKTTYYWEYSKAVETAERVERYLKAYHMQFPYRSGCDKRELKEQLFSGWKLEVFELLLKQMEKEKILKRFGNLIAELNFQVQMDENLKKFSDEFCNQLEKAGYQFVEYRKIRFPNLSEMQYNDMIECLIQLEILVRISDEFVTTSGIAQEIEKKVKAYFQHKEILSYTELRDLLQSTRKSVRPLMTYLDQRGITEWFGHETERREKRKKDKENEDELRR